MKRERETCSPDRQERQNSMCSSASATKVSQRPRLGKDVLLLDLQRGASLYDSKRRKIRRRLEFCCWKYVPQQQERQSGADSSLRKSGCFGNLERVSRGLAGRAMQRCSSALFLYFFAYRFRRDAAGVIFEFVSGNVPGKPSSTGGADRLNGAPPVADHQGILR